MTYFREGRPKSPSPIREQPQKNPSWIGLKVVLYIKQQFANDIHDDIIDVSLFASKMIASTIIFAYQCSYKIYFFKNVVSEFGIIDLYFFKINAVLFYVPLSNKRRI